MLAVILMVNEITNSSAFEVFMKLLAAFLGVIAAFFGFLSTIIRRRGALTEPELNPLLCVSSKKKSFS